MMATDVCTCSPEATLHDVAEAMWKNDIGCVPVVDHSGRVIGMITDRDICMLAYRRKARLDELQAHEAMSSILLTCTPDDTVHEVEILMSANKLRRLPVVDDDGRLCGIVSLNDVARAAPKGKGDAADHEARRVAATLAAVSAHRPNPGSSGSD
jgi:CBS domain-containing protein